MALVILDLFKMAEVVSNRATDGPQSHVFPNT